MQKQYYGTTINCRIIMMTTTTIAAPNQNITRCHEQHTTLVM